MIYVTNILYSCMIVTVFICLFSVIGMGMLSRLHMESDNLYWNLSASFFVGLAVWLAALRTVAYFLPSYRLSFYLSAAFFAIIAVLCIKKRNIARMEWGGGITDRIWLSL